MGLEQKSSDLRSNRARCAKQYEIDRPEVSPDNELHVAK
jgi:hypothetical protein